MEQRHETDVAGPNPSHRHTHWWGRWRGQRRTQPHVAIDTKTRGTMAVRQPHTHVGECGESGEAMGVAMACSDSGRSRAGRA